MTNYQRWKANKDFEDMQDEFQECFYEDECWFCPAYDDCQGDLKLCCDTEALRKWADTEVTAKG